MTHLRGSKERRKKGKKKKKKRKKGERNNDAIVAHTFPNKASKTVHDGSRVANRGRGRVAA